MKKALIPAAALLLFGNLSFGQMLSHPIRAAHVPGRTLGWSQVAFDPSGIAHCVFMEDTLDAGDVLWYFSYDGTTVSELFNVAGSRSTKVQQMHIAVSNRGVIGVIWGDSKDRAVYLRLYDPAQRRWLDIEKVSDGAFDEPMVQFDTQGNIFVFFWGDSSMHAYSRAKINGVWEGYFRISTGGGSHPGGIAVGRDGRVWAMSREKVGNEYKLYYRKRTASTPWGEYRAVNNAGASVAHPHIAAGGPDNMAYIVTGDVDEATEMQGQMIFEIKLDELTNPRSQVADIYAQHYPRVAIDIYGNRHCIIQLGAGDSGTGARYTNTIGGRWNPLQTLAGAWVKCPGIAADDWGNVVVCWTDMQGDQGSYVWLNSLYPITPRYFYAPINLSSSIEITSPKQNPQVTYELRWEPNPENNDDYLGGYNIYVKEGSGNYTLLQSVSKSTFSARFTFESVAQKRTFGITTVSMGGAESEMVYFQ